MKTKNSRYLLAFAIAAAAVTIWATWHFSQRSTKQASTLSQLDPKLIGEIRAWRRGDPPPARLLQSADDNSHSDELCGLSRGPSVNEYISQIEDTDLLTALIFDPHVQDTSLRAAVSHLVMIKDVGFVARLVADKRKSEPSAFKRLELAGLSEHLCDSYAAVKVARLSLNDMEPLKAETALQAMRTDLQAGMTWADAYRKHADLHPDIRDRAANPNSVRTLICYLYSGTVSSNGFDILTYSYAELLTPEHLSELFRFKRGTHIFKGAHGVYLYHIESYYGGSG